MVDIRPFIASSRLARCLILLFFVVAYFGCLERAAAQVTANPETKASANAGTTNGINPQIAAAASSTMPRMRSMTNAQRKASAAKLAIRRSAQAALGHVAKAPNARANAIVGGSNGTALTRDQLYFGGLYPNYANSPLPNPADTVNCTGANVCGIRKFQDSLAGLNAPNNLGQQIPIAVPDTTTFPGSDYYEISLVSYTEKMHTDLPPTHLLGYMQTNVSPAAVPHYLGPLIIAHTNRPVRLKFVNNLPAGAAGNLKIPTDLTVMGSGLGLASGSPIPYLQNRATVHLHGGNTPWISDGTPHQWTIPVSEWNNTTEKRGASVSFVPDMYFLNNVVVQQCTATLLTGCSPTPLYGTAASLPAGATNDPGPGALTFYYTNQQSARLMFYHDHAYGTTRLNVYAGEAAGYLLTDDVEADLVNGTNGTGVFTTAGIAPAPVIPAEEIPLVIQDKSFVPQNPVSTTVYSVPVMATGSGYTAPVIGFVGGCTVPPVAAATFGLTTDAWGNYVDGAITGINLTSAGSGCTSNPVVTITDPTGTGAAAIAYVATLSQQDPTWDPAIWGTYGDLWYPHVYMPNQWPGDPGLSGSNPMGRWDYASWFWPTFQSPSGYQVRGELPCFTPDSPAQTCPGTPSALDPAPLVDYAGGIHLGAGSVASLTPEAFMDTPMINGTVYPTLTLEPKPYRFRILSVGNDRTIDLSWFQACGVGGYTPSATAIPCPLPTVAGIGLGTEVGMVPAAPTAGFPKWWPTDGRDGGVPDPAASGPSWVVIGNEGGVLPAPAVIPAAPTNYEYNRRSVTVTNTSSVGLELMPAERADVIVDFTAFANKTLILYNDAPAPNPAFDARYDYYTGDPDQSGTGGAPTTLVGFGPNTRTLMQVHVGGTVSTTEPAVNLANLKKVIPAAFKISQPVPVVPEAIYSSIYNQPMINHYPALQDQNITFIPIGGTTAVTLPLRFKTIQELFELDYGRMNATLGTELPFTNFNTQTTIPLGYVDPFTEDVYDTAHDANGVASQLVGSLGDGSQVWMVIHNGVDSHAIHFHLYNVQVLDRVGWDGTIRAPLPIEQGWKDTVRMNPLEIDFVALRPMSQTLPFPVPDSVRLFDVTRPAGAAIDPAMSAFNPQNNASPQTNSVQAMGWEYVWHCHILGHEENDMMRDEVFQVPPAAPINVTQTGSTLGTRISFTDMALSEAGFTLQSSTSATFTTIASTIELPANVGWNTVVGSGLLPTAGGPYFYRVQSHKPDADYWRMQTLNPTPTGAWPDLVSPWAYVTSTSTAPIIQLSPALSFGLRDYLTTSPPQTATLTNIGLTAANISLGINGTNATSFAISGTTCGATLPSGGTCTINVTFTPQAGGALGANLSVTSNDPVNPVVSVALTGTGQFHGTVTPNAASKLWLAADPVPLTTGTLTGFLPADGITATYSRTAGSAPGQYTITATLAPVAALGKYNLTYNTALFTIYAAAQMTTPATNGSTLTGTSQAFAWNTGGGAPGEQYQLWVGTTGVGSSNIYSGPYTTALGVTVPGIPQTGGTLYVRLRTFSFGAWVYRDYTYVEPGTPVPAVITSPVNGATVSSPVPFVWTTGTGVTQYQLLIGTTAAGSSNTYTGPYTTATSVSVPLPGSTAGGTIFVTLRSFINGVWQSNNYTYKVSGTAVPAALTAPAAGSTVVSPVAFSWNIGTGVTQYQLMVGSTVAGSSNIYNGAYTTATSASVPLPGTIAGGTIYVTLRSLIAGVWQSNAYTYRVAGTPVASVISTPVAGSHISGTLTFTWTVGTGVNEYQLLVGNTGNGSSNFYNGAYTANTSASVTIPAGTTGTVNVRVRSFINGTWQNANYTYVTP